MSELKPCPFCNNPNTQYSDSDSPHTCCDEDLNVYAHCEHCNTKIKGKSDNEVEAIWNTRPIEDALRAENDKMREILRDFVNGYEADIYGAIANGNTCCGIDEGVVRGNEFLKSLIERANALSATKQEGEKLLTIVMGKCVTNTTMLLTRTKSLKEKMPTLEM